MKTSRTDDSRRVDWSKVKGTKAERLAKLEAHVARFVAGIKGERQNEVTQAQILKWFHGTPEEFVKEAILAAVTNDKIRCFRRSLVARTNSAYVYAPTVESRPAPLVWENQARTAGWAPEDKAAKNIASTAKAWVRFVLFDLKGKGFSKSDVLNGNVYDLPAPEFDLIKAVCEAFPDLRPLREAP